MVWKRLHAEYVPGRGRPMDDDVTRSSRELPMGQDFEGLCTTERDYSEKYRENGQWMTGRGPALNTPWFAVEY